MEVIQILENYVIIEVGGKRHYLPKSLAVKLSEDCKYILVGTVRQLYEMDTYIVAIPVESISPDDYVEAFGQMTKHFKGLL